MLRIKLKVRHNIAIAVYLTARNTYEKSLINRVRDKIPNYAAFLRIECPRDGNGMIG